MQYLTRLQEDQGEPRNAIYPEDQASDYKCTLEYMRVPEEVDGGTGSACGTRASAAPHVLTLLTLPPRGVKCGVTQVPRVYMHRTLEMHHGSLAP